jgi:trigger factor
MAMQFGQKAKDIRRMYEQNDAVAELMSQMRKSKAMDWLLHHVEMVDRQGQLLDRDTILGHTHDDEPDEHHEADIGAIADAAIEAAKGGADENESE